MERIVILGATAAIAEATARIWAKEGASFFLAGRNPERLAAVAADLEIRGASAVTTTLMDANHPATLVAAVEQAWNELEKVDIVLVAHGSLPDQALCQGSWEATLTELTINGTSAIAAATVAAAHLERQGSGTLAVIASPAGERGRQSNYTYGAAKAALAVFTQGVRNRLSRHGVQVVTILPGFVDTPMTRNFPKGPLWATPDQVARGIVTAIRNRKDVVYLPFFWFWIMLIIKHIPERIFKRLRL